MIFPFFTFLNCFSVLVLSDETLLPSDSIPLHHKPKAVTVIWLYESLSWMVHRVIKWLLANIVQLVESSDAPERCGFESH